MSKTIRLLYVRGRQDGAHSIEAAFRKRGAELQIGRVADHAALRSALNQADWNVVVCDCVASERAAARTVEQVCDCDPMMPVIVICDSITETETVELMRAGAKDVVRRSDLTDLPDLVEKEVALGSRRRRRVIGREATMTATLNASEARYRLIVDNANDGICMFDRDADITFANRRLSEMLGHAVDDLIGMNILRLVSEESLEMARTRFAYRQAGRRLVETFECSFTHSNGRNVMAIVTSTPFSAGDGWAGCFLLITDVTEIRNTYAALRQSQRLNALGVLAGGMAHDMNNMLMPIIGLTEIAIKDLPRGSRAEQCLEKVIDAAEQISETVQGLLAFSRAKVGDRKPREFKTVVGSAIALVRLALPQSIEIEADIERAEGQVDTDPVEINQILTNLASNAQEAMNRQGVLSITLERVDRSGFTGQPAAGAVREFMKLTVRDTGRGVPEDRIESIFDPFSTDQPVGEGTGLGLSIVYGIVTDHGGSIELHSKLGEGAEFALYFPIYAESKADAAA